MPDLDLTAITAARLALAEHHDRLRVTELALARARAGRDTALAAGDAAAAAAASATAEQLSVERTDVITAEHDARGRITALADRLLAAGRAEEAVASLSAAHPVLMLPVRVETRFADAGQTLRVRIFPDQLHVTAHDPALTPSEEEGLRWYWQHRWPDRVTSERPGGTATADARADAAWEVLASRLRPGRAAFLVRTYPPVNLDSADAEPVWADLPRRASAWSSAARAALLPDRWCVIGFRREAEGRHREIFRRWGRTVPDTLAAGPTPFPGEPDEPRGLPDDPELRWLHNPTSAEEVGMLVTVRQADLTGGARLRDGVDRLVVLGVDRTLDPAQAAAALQAQLAAHADEGELAFIPQGIPTNHIGTQRSGFTTDPDAARTVLAPHRTATVAAAPDDAAGPVIAAALGLPRASFAHLPGADLREQAWQRGLLDALWPATGGYYLTEMLDPVAADRRIESALREHVAAHLRASGPLPTVRISDQPYGLLPVTPRRTFTPTPGRRAQRDIHRVAGLLRELVEPLVTSVPHLAQVRRRSDADDVLLALLQRTPVAWSLTFRQLVGPVQRKAMSLRWDLIAAFQRDVTATVFHRLECYQLTLLSELTHGEDDHPLDVPLVLRPEPTEGEPARQGTGYLTEILAALAQPGARTLLDGRTNSVALLEAFLAYAAVRDLDLAAKETARVAAPSLGLSAEFVGYLSRTADRVPYTLRVEATPTPPAAPGSRVPVPTTPLELASTVLPGLTGTATLAEHIATRFREELPLLPQLLERPHDPLHRLARYTDAVRTLAAAPPDQLEWAFRGVLDLYATRLDAWVTSLASARLAERRAKAPDGVHLGGWGVVEDLRPDSGPAAESLGFMHAPSLSQATSLAVLRSARMNHRDGDGSVFDLDLTSRRVREALKLLEGMGNGQRLAALLGYRIERALQERDLTLARWILPLRQQCPLRSDRPDEPGVAEPVEVVAARDVVDGVALLARWANEGDGLLTAAGVDPGARQAVRAVLDDVAGLADAVSDVLVAEAVHQATAGNLERSGAALSAHDRQGKAPDPEFVRTPRGGTTVTHRVGLWVPADNDVPAPGWPQDIRSLAEPRLDRWCGVLLGDPQRWQVRAQLVRPTEDGGPAATTDLAPLDIGELDVSALSLVLAAQRPGAGQPSELELRLALALGHQAETAGLRPGPNDEISIDPGSLVRLLDLAGWAAEVTASAALTASELSTATDLSVDVTGPPPATVDLEEASGRAQAVVHAARSAVDGLAAATDALAAVPPGRPDTVQLRAVQAALLHAVTLDGPEALLPAAPVAGTPDDPVEHVHGVLERLRVRLEGAQSLLAAAVTPEGPGSAGAGATDGTDDPRLAAARGAIRVLLGHVQPFLPVLQATEPAPLRASLASRANLLDGTPSAVVTWLHTHALVRPALDPLASLLVHAEADGADVAGDLALIQTPHQPDAHWAALPFGTSGPPEHGTVALVLHAPFGLDPGAPGAGVVVDAWTETVPSGEDTTAVAFHYDAPGARAPQTMLLAVHPDPAGTSWDFAALLGCVHEAMDLARLRTVGAKELAPFSTFLPALFLPDNYTRDVPGIRFRELLGHIESLEAGGLVSDHVLGKAVNRA